ncbi:MAG: DUF501 domain-containing protein [Synergistaceae bacterium]|nr:DUF501 domain-containing protein [Synergistaceae bacterium]
MNRRLTDDKESGNTEFQTPFSPATEEDIRILLQQCRGRKFDARRLLGVALRCRFGKPQIIICDPLLNDKPFPTLYWLTCPFLDRLCGRLEASGAVSAMEIFLQDRADEWFAYHQHYAALRLRLLRQERSQMLKTDNERAWEHLVSGGVGGIEYEPGHVAVKCLHLQVGTWLGMGNHPARSWLEDRVTPLECDGGLCG